MKQTSVDIETFKKEYRAYHDAKQRCSNPKHPRYLDWGGRGIKFLLPSFQEFIAYLGKAPKGSSIDRIDNDGDYQINNIRWSSKAQQQHNKRVSSNNSTGITGVRSVKANGLITPTYQAYIHVNKKFIQLYTGPSFEDAVQARKTFEKKLRNE